MRIELARYCSDARTCCCFDEPTNHLDIESIQWLENFLVTKAKALWCL